MPIDASKFRYDINAVRGIAVLSVLLYHFDVPGFSGGYVGVDIFFVISGFLMSEIIVNKITEARFSFKDFYIARIRRILPALCTLIIASIFAGYFWLIPLDYKHMGEEARSAIFFISNSFFAQKGGYFDPVSHERWLLHTWSLSIEMQFYVLWPIFLWLLLKYKRQALQLAVIALFTTSLIWSVIYTFMDSDAAFFALTPRIWEFVAGGLIFFYQNKIKAGTKSAVIGLTITLAAIFFYSSEMAYPGYWAIIPVLGTALIISAKPKFFANILPLQIFGNISYSLYLWHWPVMLWAKYFGIPFTLVNVSGLLTLSVILALVSYYFIETPMRQRLNWKVSLGVGVIAILAPSLVLIGKGLPERVSEQVRAAENARKDINPRLSECIFDGKNTLPNCKIGAKGNPTIAIWGDSHADSLFVAIDEALKESGNTGVFHALSACPPAMGELKAAIAKDLKQFEKCQQFKKLVWDEISSNPNIKEIILIGRWSRYFNKVVPANEATDRMVADEYKHHIVDTVCTLTNLDKSVYLVAPIPEMGQHVPRELAKALLVNQSNMDISSTLADYKSYNQLVLGALATAKKKCQATILDPKSYMCNENTCNGLINGVPNYRDDHHLSVTGSLILKPLFLGVSRSN